MRTVPGATHHTGFTQNTHDPGITQNIQVLEEAAVSSAQFSEAAYLLKYLPQLVRFRLPAKQGSVQRGQIQMHKYTYTNSA